MPPPADRPDLPTACVLVLLAGPVLAGLVGTALPAFGYLPALGYRSLSFAPFQDLLATPGLWMSVLLSFTTGLGAAFVSLVAVCVFSAGWYGTRTFHRLSRFLSPLLSVPHAAAAIGLAFLIAPSGFLARLVSPWATGWDRPPDLLILNDPAGLSMTFALVAKEVPFLFLMMLAALNRPHLQNTLKAGASLGYGRMAAFFKCILPQVYPLIRLPMLAVIAYSTSVVDVAQILGPTTPPPLAPRLVQWMSDPDLTKRLMASAGALLQLCVSGSALAAYLLLERLAAACFARPLVNGHRHGNDRIWRRAALVPMLVIVATMGLALLLLGLWSLARSWWFPATLPSRWGLARFQETFAMAGPALSASFALAVAASLLATALTLWLLESRSRGARPAGPALKAILFLPLLLPQISFLFGLQMLFLVLDLSGSFQAVLLAHLVFVLPYAFLALSDPWARLDPRYAKAAAALGASPRRIFWQVKLPLLLRSVLVTLAVAAAVSVGQYLPTLMIGAGRLVTVTTESVALASGGNRQIAALYGLLQLLIPLAGFALAALVPALAFHKRATLRLER